MSNSTTITREQLRTVLIATELGGKTDDSGHFSYAELGSSSSSFGQMQFDVDANPAARKFLADNGFDAADIATLRRHEKPSDKDKTALDAKLQAIPQTKLDQFTGQQLDVTIGRVDDIVDKVRKQNPAAADAIVNDAKLQLGVADYANQFSSRHDGQLAGFLAGNAERGIRARNPPTQDDMQNFIGASAYGQDPANARGIKGRAERLEGALHQLNLSDSRQAPSHAMTDKADTTLKEHAHGAAVLKLQGELAELGYTDSRGRPLQPDGHFGPATEAAVKAFQAEHSLTQDGKVGPATQHAIQAALAPLNRDDPGLLPAVSAMSSLPAGAPGLEDPRNALNPNHALYNELHRRIPEASENRLLQFTAACHEKAITDQNLGAIHLNENTGEIHFVTSGIMLRIASVDIKEPSPQPAQSIQNIQQTDQYQAQIQAQVQAQMTPANAQAQQGPALGGR